MNHYKVLGVSMDASPAAIRTAYRRRVLALHPDRAGDAASAAFLRVVAAYEVLSNPGKRARYDDGLTREGTAATSGEGPFVVAPRDVLTRISGPVRSLLATGALVRRDDESFELRVTADEARQGGYAVVSTSPPNQLTHWVTIPPGTPNGHVMTSVVRAGDTRSVLQLRIRVSGQ
jgi:curved DNA-binding protein CbpA